jgi:MSHA pilin protein MshD
MSIERARQRGVTLIELIVFIVIVSVAVVGVLQVMRLNTANSADPLRRKQALMIAEALMEEVQLAKFTYCDPASDNAESAPDSASCDIPERFGQGGGAGAAAEPVGPRPYDNVNDYVPAANVSTAAFDVGNVLSDASGAPMALAGYSARLTIVPESLGGIASGNSPSDVGDVLRISVAVSYDNQTLVLDGYRTRYAPNAP